MSELIPPSEKLRVHNFQYTMTGDEGVIAISELVKIFWELKECRCSSTSWLGSEGGVVLAEALEKCTLLRKLDLHDNMFGILKQELL